MRFFEKCTFKKVQWERSEEVCIEVHTSFLILLTKTNSPSRGPLKPVLFARFTVFDDIPRYFQNISEITFTILFENTKDNYETWQRLKY